ncbi:MAG: DUF4242 domain-containing protein [Sandaracinaceae bacterium]|nr:DUF4242 domain-containing protein [Sandaracinaceae bacterium]
MQTYLILRRGAFRDADHLAETAIRSRRVGDEEMPTDVRWIRSYVLREPDGALGTACVYQASSPEAIREHARRVGMRADEVLPIDGTVVIRPDPREGEA